MPRLLRAFRRLTLPPPRPCPGPLDHPQIARMSPRELADLPLPRDSPPTRL
ncbi:hypothetical protein ACXN5S_03170 [Pseudoroseicyclus sp. H15]